MTSTASLGVPQLMDTINRDGLIYLKDAAKALQANEFARKGFPITTVEGVNFCKIHTSDDLVSKLHCRIFLLPSYHSGQHITGILESLYDRSVLRMFRYFYPFPACAHDYIVQQSENKALVVQIWTSQSQMILFKGSCWLELKPLAHNDMLEISHDGLCGCVPTNVNMEEGGL